MQPALRSISTLYTEVRMFGYLLTDFLFFLSSNWTEEGFVLYGETV